MTDQQFKELKMLLVQLSGSCIKNEANSNTIIELFALQMVKNECKSKDEVNKIITALNLQYQKEITQSTVRVMKLIFPDFGDSFDEFLKPNPKDN